MAEYICEIEKEDMYFQRYGELKQRLVRCKDCIYYHKPEIGFSTGDCTYRTAWYPVDKEEFCSLAKPKDGVNNG